MVDMEQARRRLASRRAAGTLAGMPLEPKNVDEALIALETVAERLHQDGDARAAFPDIYSIITRKVAEQVHRKDGIFLEPIWISRLAGRFCERYLETLRWSIERRPQDCDAWSATYACSTLARTLPVQHVLLGLSAHINFDLALGIYETILEFGHEACPEMLARYKHDHDQVNALLLASIPEAFEHLSRRHGCVVSSALYSRAFKTARWFTMHLLSHWRAQVWGNVLGLLGAKSQAEQTTLIATMERRSGFYGRLLKLPSDIAHIPFSARSSERPAVASVISLNKPVRGERRPCPADMHCPRERMCA
jgi:hypothetical protein